MKTYKKPQIKAINVNVGNMLNDSLSLGDPNKPVGGGLSRERGNAYYGDDEGTISW